MYQIVGLTGLFEDITDRDLHTRREESVAASAPLLRQLRQRRPDDVDEHPNSHTKKLPTPYGRVEYHFRLIDGSRTAECRRPT